MKPTGPWAIKWAYANRLDGYREALLGGARFQRPDEWSGHTIMVFRTKAMALAHIKQHFGYIAMRPDLRREPHCWRMPKPVRVTVSISEAAS